ncbi:2-polyprenyl-3-methyl-6-methoxy-1,4-benzoquinone monooxygenase [Allopusillimonas soli]|nr:2-polyprenyl-3-methyl-6-methoxy-1,4-benzoquinone monooxygenase [Allopusillimonas soli]
MTRTAIPSTPSMFERRLGTVDRILSEIGRAAQVLAGVAQASRPNPAGKQAPVAAQTHATAAPMASPEDAGAGRASAEASAAAQADALTPEQARHAAGLMRVNHVGEICAQALYRGQALFCGDASIRNLLYQAASEEVDHLAWCRERVVELGGRPSLLNPLWYAGSFTLGVVASHAGVPRNLGFMAETERQVEQHLEGHLRELPPNDYRSRRIVAQMREDEIHHRDTAEVNGAHRLPAPARLAMRAMSRVMTTTAYRI